MKSPYPYLLAFKLLRKHGQETGQLARVIRANLEGFLRRCQIEANRFEEEPETPSFPDQPLLEFEYENWRGHRHTYLVEPEAIQYGGYNPGGYHGDNGPQRWVLHGQVVSRDGDTRPGMGVRRRTFILDKVQYLREVDACPPF